MATVAGVRLRPAATAADATFIADQMVSSSLEFAQPGVPFGLAAEVSKPGTRARWLERCVEKLQHSMEPGAGAHTRLWVAERVEDGAILGTVGVQPDHGGDMGSSEIAGIVLDRLAPAPPPAGRLALGELVSFYVVAAARGRGVGALLMATALGFARESGYAALSLYVFRALAAAIRVYEAHGFFVALQYHAPGHWDEDNVMVKFLLGEDALPAPLLAAGLTRTAHSDIVNIVSPSAGAGACAEGGEAPALRTRVHGRAHGSRLAQLGRQLQPTVVGAMAAGRAVEEEPPLRVGIITEATGDHLGGYLKGLATAPGRVVVCIADPTGAQFEVAAKALGDRLIGTYTRSAARGLTRPYLTPILRRIRMRAPSSVFFEDIGMR